MAYSDRFEKALVFAAQIHRDQVRRGSNVPYVNHLLAVASIVGEAGGTEDQVIAGLLHDAIEDCIGEIPDIRAKIAEDFGEAVLHMVEACTDADTDPKPPWRPRKEAYLAHLLALPSDAPALLVSLADKIHNSGSILRDYRQVGDALWDRFRGKRDGTLWYYTELARVFVQLKPGPQADELAGIVAKISALAMSDDMD